MLILLYFFFDNMSDYSDQMIRPLLTYLNLNFELPFTMWNKCSAEKTRFRVPTLPNKSGEKKFRVFHGFEILCSCRIQKYFMYTRVLKLIEVDWFFAAYTWQKPPIWDLIICNQWQNQKGFSWVTSLPISNQAREFSFLR